MVVILPLVTVLSQVLVAKFVLYIVWVEILPFVVSLISVVTVILLVVIIGRIGVIISKPWDVIVVLLPPQN